MLKNYIDVYESHNLNNGLCHYRTFSFHWPSNPDTACSVQCLRPLLCAGDGALNRQCHRRGHRRVRLSSVARSHKQGSAGGGKTDDHSKETGEATLHC